MIPYKIQAKGKELKHWEDAFRGIRAAGGTAPESAVMQLLKDGGRVEQFIVVTDEGENNPSGYRKSLDIYQRETGIKPYTLMVRTAGSRWGLSSVMTNSLKAAGYETDSFDFDVNKTDYYSLPNLIHYLTKPNRTELLMEIMAYPLAERKNERVAAN